MVLSHHLWCEHLFISTHLFDHTIWCLITPKGNMFPTHHVWSNCEVDHTIRISYHTIDILFTSYVVHHTIHLVSHQQGTIIPYLCAHTKRLYDHTEVVHVHTRNKFIHTEMEQTILYSIHITLHHVISYSKLPPLTHTNDTDTHAESRRNPHS